MSRTLHIAIAALAGALVIAAAAPAAPAPKTVRGTVGPASRSTSRSAAST
jgi:hypothetical protein